MNNDEQPGLATPYHSKKGGVMSDVIQYHRSSGPLYWNAERVMSELGVSRPTAYRLMHESGAESYAMRHLRVFAPDFINFLNRKEGPR